MSVSYGGSKLGSYRGDTKTMSLSEDKGHGKNPSELAMSLGCSLDSALREVGLGVRAEPGQHRGPGTQGERGANTVLGTFGKAKCCQTPELPFQRTNRRTKKN